MKSSTDPRHRKRLLQVEAVFATSFGSSTQTNIDSLLQKLSELDAKISQAAPEWPLDKINKINLAILRVATYELMYDEEVPAKVAVDEAVEIAKSLGSDNSPAFVNGVLGKIMKEAKDE